MVRCKNCGNFTSVYGLDRCFYTDSDTGYQGVKKVCPFCGDDEFSKAQRCPRCKGLHTEKYALCTKCVDELKAELENFLKNYTVEEQEAMLS